MIAQIECGDRPTASLKEIFTAYIATALFKVIGNCISPIYSQTFSCRDIQEDTSHGLACFRINVSLLNGAHDRIV